MNSEAKFGQSAKIHLPAEAKSFVAEIYYMTKKSSDYFYARLIWSEKTSVDLVMPFTRLLTFSYWSINSKIWLPLNGMDISPMYLKEDIGTSQVVQVVKNPPANAEDIRDAVSIQGLGRSPGEGNGNPL